MGIVGSSFGQKCHLSTEFTPLFSSDSGKNEKNEGCLLQNNEATEDFSLTVELAGNDSVGELSTTPNSFSAMTGGAFLVRMIFS